MVSGPGRNGLLRRLTAQISLLPGMMAMLALFAVPFLLVLVKSITDPVLGWENYRQIFGNSLYLHVFTNTLVSAVGTTIGCLVIGYPLAYVIFRSAGRQRRLMLALIVFAYGVGTIPRAFSWIVVLGDRGLANRALSALTNTDEPIKFLYSQTGVLIGMVHVMLPFITLILLATMARVSPHLVPAARTLGATPSRAFWHVFFPLTRSGVFAAGLLVFIYSLGFYVIPAVLGGASQTTVVMEIQHLVLDLGQWGLGAALSAILATASVLGTIVYVRTTGLTATAMAD